MLYSKSECPVQDFDKTWVDDTLIWFEQKLGKDFIKNGKHLIPADCKFKYQNFDSHEAIQYFIDFIATYIQLDASRIVFRLVWEDDDIELSESRNIKKDGSNFIQEYNLNAEGKYEIEIDEEMLDDFDTTFISLVHKLTYIKMLEKNVFTFENYYMVDYAMVLFGFGILMTNVFVKTNQWGGLRYSEWRVTRTGMLNHRVCGYLFAVLSNYRKENNPDWKKHLCTDAKNFYIQSCKFLEESMENESSLNKTTLPVKDEDVFYEKYFYEGGGIRLVAHIINGKYEGLTSYYYEDGQLWSELIYKNDNPFTVLSNYNPYEEEVEKGTLKEGNGTLYIYKVDGNLDTIETYVDGIKI